MSHKSQELEASIDNKNAVVQESIDSMINSTHKDKDSIRSAYFRAVFVLFSIVLKDLAYLKKQSREVEHGSD